MVRRIERHEYAAHPEMPAVVQVSLPRGRVALIDEEDADLVRTFPSWYLRIHHGNEYAYAYLGKNSHIRMHRLIANYIAGRIDHENGNGLDNRKSNLRPGVGWRNMANQRHRKSIKTSQYKGVCWSKVMSSWWAQIGKDRKHHSLGFFKSEEDAAKTYDAKAIELFGEYACINFPDGIHRTCKG